MFNWMAFGYSFKFGQIAKIGAQMVLIFAILISLFASVVNVIPVRAATSLTVTPIAWNVIGLDSNKVTVGPNHFPVGARVCNTGGSTATNVLASFVWDTTPSPTYINIRPGTYTTLPAIASLATSACTDFYFEVEVTRDSSAYDTKRSYHIAVTADSGATTASTPTPRELYVEHLVSQSRNTVSNVEYGATLGSLTSVGAGGTMTLLVGNTYYIKMTGSTATNGYEQSESFLTLPNTIFQVLSASTTYTADSSVSVSSPNDKLYGDACTWESNPLSPNYRSCLDVGKVGGGITVTYQVTIISAPAAPLVNPEPLTTLVYDFSGSSYHYNADFSASTRFVQIADPTSSTISKSFSPSAIGLGGVSRLTISINNTVAATVSGYNFTDPLPTNMKVATPPNASTSSCGSPTFAPAADATSLTFTNGTIAANGSCTIQVDVTTITTGSPFTNTTNHLFVGSLDTGKTASANLTVTTAPTPPSPPASCTDPTEMARWEFASGTQGDGFPLYTSKQSDLTTATTSYTTVYGTQAIHATGNPTPGWGGTAPVASSGGAGWSETSSSMLNYFEFVLDTSQYGGVYVTFDGNPFSGGDWANPNSQVFINIRADAGGFTAYTPIPQAAKGNWTSLYAGAAATGTSTTTFRFGVDGASSTKRDATFILDNVKFYGCRIPNPPTITKSFSPSPVAVGATSTLTFNITNPSSAVGAILNGISFSDYLPSENLQGTVAVASGSAAIVGTGTAFKAQLVVGSVVSIPSALVNLTGTVSVTTGSNTVTGFGTTFSTQLAIGSVISVGSVNYTVAAIATDTSLTLTRTYRGSTASGQTASTYKNYTVSSITDDTHLTLTATYAGLTTSGLVMGAGLTLTATPTTTGGSKVVGASGYKAISLSGGSLTGTVAATNASPTVIGTSTAFTSELGVGSQIRLPYQLSGTVAVTLGSDTVTGTGTLFTTELAIRKIITINSVNYIVAGITNATSLRLTTTYAGSTASGLTARAYKNYTVASSASATSLTLTTNYASAVNLSGLTITSGITGGRSLTGTVSVTSGNATVTGTSTKFLTDLKVGNMVTINSVKYTVSAIASDTSLTLSSTYAGLTASGLTMGLASATCTVTATVKANAAGIRANLSGIISATESGDNTTSTGYATANLSAVLPPVISKSFSANPILAGSGNVSTLTFTITNPNQNDTLSGLAFTDTFPVTPGTGIKVAATPSASSTCGGSFTFVPTAAAGSITFPTTGTPTLAGGASCTVKVNVTAPTASGNLTGTLTVTNGSSAVTGSGTLFSSELAVDRTIYINSTSYRVLSIADNTHLTLTANYGGTTSSGVTMPAGYFNVSGAVSHVINSATVTGNKASNTLLVNTPNPSISLQKQIGTSSSGPWYSSMIIAAGSSVYYKFTVENTGDVALNPVSITDNTVTMTACNSALAAAGALPVAVAANENHIRTCVVGPITAATGSVNNTAYATGTGGTTVNSTNDIAIYQNGNFGHLPSAYTNMNLYNEGGAFSLNGSTYLGSSVTTNATDGINTVGYTNKATDDGVTNTPDVTWVAGGSGSVDLIITCPSTCYLNAWFDWNKDNDFGDSGEQIFTNQSVSNGNVTLTFNIPAGTTLDGTFYSRFRLTDQPMTTPSPYGTALNGTTALVGETEDPFFTITGGVTTPVTLSYFKAERQGSKVNFIWSTATETGNIGFNLYVDSGKGRVRINQELIPSNAVDSLDRQDYLYAAKVKGDIFFIEDVSVLGETRQHGPFNLGEEFGSQVNPDKIDWVSIIEENRMAQADRRNSIPMNMAIPAIGLEIDPESTAKERFVESQKDGSILMPETGLPGESQPAGTLEIPPAQDTTDQYASRVNLMLRTTLNLKVNQTGMYRVTYEMLRDAGLDLSGVAFSKITLTNGGKEQPIYVQAKDTFGPGSFFEFYGQALDTIYTDTNIYTLQLSRLPIERIPLIDGQPAKGILSAFYPETLVVNNQRAYANYSPGNDAWYDTQMLTFTTPKTWSFPFQVDGLNAAAPASLELVVWGVTDWPQSSDHHLLASLNGVALTDQTFDGLVEQKLKIELPVGLLQEGTNILQLTLPGDTGVDVELVTLDQFSVTYQRTFKAQDGRLTFKAAGEVFKVTNLPSKNVVVYRLEKNRMVKLRRIQVQADGDTFTASFAGTPRTSTYLVTTVESLYSPVFEATRLQVKLNQPAQYLIISHPNFIDGIQPLVQARQAQGLTVSVVDVTDLYTQYTYGIFDPQAIQTYIAYAVKNLGTQYVLLVGGDTYDYRNYLGVNSMSFIPSLYAKTGPIASFVPVDPLYADVDKDNIPDVAIGRFPVRTINELNMMVNKTLAYTGKDYGRTAVFASDLNDGGTSFKNISLALSAGMPSNWAVENVHLDDMNVVTARSQLIAAMNRGTALVTFTGHSGPQEWTFSNLFNIQNAATLTNAGRPFVVVQWGCWNNYYVDPIYNYLVQSFLLSGDRGAAAVLGATTLADSNSEHLLGQLLTPRLTQPGMTLGQALQISKSELAQTHPELLDVLLGWSLMGDPALVIEP